jgi:hypothetical protein
MVHRSTYQTVLNALQFGINFSLMKKQWTL